MPLPKVRGVGEAEVFKVVRTGKSKREYIMGYVLMLQLVVNCMFLYKLEVRLH